MKKLITLTLLSFISLSSYSYLNNSDEINSMISGFDMCDDSQNPEIFEKMYKELQASDAKNEENPFKVEISYYSFSFESDKNQCDVYVDPYDWRCYTSICQ